MFCDAATAQRAHTRTQPEHAPRDVGPLGDQQGRHHHRPALRVPDARQAAARARQVARVRQGREGRGRDEPQLAGALDAAGAIGGD